MGILPKEPASILPLESLVSFTITSSLMNYLSQLVLILTRRPSSITGATVGPHSIILGSNMATMERETEEDDAPQEEVLDEKMGAISDPEKSGLGLNGLQDPFASSRNPAEGPIAMGVSDQPVEPEIKRRSLESCRSYLSHATFDIAASLFTLPLSK